MVVANRKTSRSPVKLTVEQLFTVLYPPATYFSMSGTRDVTPYLSFIKNVQLDVPSGLMFWSLHGNVETANMETCPDAIIQARNNTIQHSAEYNAYNYLLTHMRALILERKLELQMIASLGDGERIPEMSLPELAHYSVLYEMQQQQKATLSVDAENVADLLSLVPLPPPGAVHSEQADAIAREVESQMNGDVQEELRQFSMANFSASQLAQARLYLSEWEPAQDLCNRMVQYNMPCTQGACEKTVTTTVGILGVACLLIFAYKLLNRWCHYIQKVPVSCGPVARSSDGDIHWDVFKQNYNVVDDAMFRQLHTQSTIKMAIRMQQTVSPGETKAGSISNAIKNQPKLQVAAGTMKTNLSRLTKLLENMYHLQLPVGKSERERIFTEKETCHRLLEAYGETTRGSYYGANSQQAFKRSKLH